MIGSRSNEEIDHILRAQRVGRLACSADDQVAEGEYEELVGESERCDALKSLLPPGSNLVSRGLNEAGKVVVFRIRLANLSGRFERQDA